MNKKEVQEMTDTEVFAQFYWHTIQLVKEANSVRGETRKTSKEFDRLMEECIKRFNLDVETLLNKKVLNE